MADHLVHPGVGRFFARGSTRRTILFDECVDVILFALAIPEEGRGVERVGTPDVVPFDQHRLEIERHGISPRWRFHAPQTFGA